MSLLRSHSLRIRSPSTRRPGVVERVARHQHSAAPESSPRSLWSYRSTRALAYTSVFVGGTWLLDTQFNASAITRNVRTIWVFSLIALDYKLNFNEEKSEQIPELHQRVGDRMYDLLTSNGGLYIKIGQAIGNNAALLPAPIQEKFAKLFDDAPQVPYSEIRSVIRSQFGKEPAGPDGLFEEFDENAIASASIAQVHKAKLKSPDGNGPVVAVKIQKPALAKQVDWDLAAYRLVMWAYEKYFELKVYFLVDFISDHMRSELDFEREAQNAIETAKYVASEPILADRVYIPKIYPEYCTKKVMVAEWIDGVRLSDRAGIFRLMGERDPRLARAPLEPASTLPSRPLKGGVAAIMDTMVQLFSAQIFSWGWVHCDPHPGNVIVRPHPLRPDRPQLVLLDHGLYVRASETFRRQYATLWRGLITMDFDTIKDVADQWGIGTPDLFASATLMKPVRFNGQPGDLDQLSQYERSVLIKERLKKFLTDTDKMPKELVFIGRNIRIVQGNNQMFGSPVNRIRITGEWASRSLTRHPALSGAQRVREYAGYVGFLAVMLGIDLAFWAARVRQWLGLRLGWASGGFEDELERTMRGIAKSSFGVDIAATAFEG
ncbi:ABC1 kinase family protein [Phanerochaete sordida]|uniref:ABC1 kinase family protein n=1 Tax=Phanerochaete sordida TaxID=48140 RepID=A0A9P3GB23_9APHY|nr:ABC1 kinase family protein [Phanerochaete sordida]